MIQLKDRISKLKVSTTKKLEDLSRRELLENSRDELALINTERENLIRREDKEYLTFINEIEKLGRKYECLLNNHS